MFVGYLYNSLALVADACHMLSDGLCLVVALVAIKELGQKITNIIISWRRSLKILNMLYQF